MKLNNDQLTGIVNRLENIDDDRKALTEDRAMIVAEAKGLGFDTKVIAAVLKRRKMERAAVEELDEMIRVYEEQLGVEVLS